MTILENGRLKVIFYVVGVHKYLCGYINNIKTKRVQGKLANGHT